MKGISHNKRNNTWIVRIIRSGAVHYIGTYPTEDTAKVAYDINFKILNCEPTGSYELPIRNKKKSLSGIKYVSWNTKLLKWSVYVPSNNGRKFLGSFSEKEDAVSTVKKYFRYSRESTVDGFETKIIDFLAIDEAKTRVIVRALEKKMWRVESLRRFDVKEKTGEGAMKRFILKRPKSIRQSFVK